MSLRATPAAPEVFSVDEVAQAAGVPVSAVAELVEAGRIRTISGFLLPEDAIVCVRALRRVVGTRGHELFEAPESARRSPVAGIAGSSALHLSLVGLLTLIAALGWDRAGFTPPTRLEPTRLVFLASPGPGGGGGGGGLRQPQPPPKAQMKTAAALVKSPVPRPKSITTQKPPRVKPPLPPPVRAQSKPVDPPPQAPRPELKPQVVAPVVSASTDIRDRAGVLTETAAESESQGPGSGAGVGTGQGSGIGEGTGSGIGPGSGGGTGGGPYRPGAGITPPSLLHEVRPDYTDAARRQGIQGEVVLEVVVRHDGSVGNLKVLSGLGAGLDQRAIEAVRQWRFAPARRYGTPVDVIVEVGVEFKLR